LPSLPEIMASSDQLAAKMERLALDTVEAALLVNHVGQEFDAVVISGSKPAKNNGNGNGNSTNGHNGTGNGNGNSHGSSGIVQIAEPAVTARCDGEMESGTKVRVKLLDADIATRQITFELLQ
jgi:exoribonuclease R